jgi:hypothetical protein
MKISSEQVRILQEQEALRGKPARGGAEFSDLLARQLNPAGTQGPGMSGPLAAAGPVAAPLPLSGLQDAQGQAEPALQEAAARLDGMFSIMESYAARIGSGNDADLRGAYALLQDMSSQVTDFKDRFPNAAREQPVLAALLNEVDVLATTETFKFNRGDYL